MTDTTASVDTFVGGYVVALLRHGEDRQGWTKKGERFYQSDLVASAQACTAKKLEKKAVQAVIPWGKEVFPGSVWWQDDAAETTG